MKRPISVVCVSSERTQEDWPKTVVAVPRIGDIVEARSGKTMTVLSVIHCQAWHDEAEKYEPYLKVVVGR